LNAHAHVSRGFAYNAARHWDMTLADNDEHDHRFTEPGRKHGQKAIRSSIGDHVD
jgi:hypothetical protein